MHVDAVEQRARDLGLVVLGAFGRATAAERRIVQMTAAAGVHGGDELESRRIGDMGIDPRHHGPPAFERLAQRLQCCAGEFRQLVQEQHAAVRQRDFAGFGAQAAADEGRQRCRVMRIAKWAIAHQPAFGELARDGMDHGDLEGCCWIERRQQARQALGQHRLASTWRPNHQQIVPAGRRHFERALGRFLAFDVGQVQGVLRDLLHPRGAAGRASGCP